MSKHPSTAIARRLALGAVSALGLVLGASSLSAQSYGDDRSDQTSYRSSSDDDIIVSAPRDRQQRSTIGAPIRNVAMARDVRFDDLDLRTAHGARELKARIRYTARTLCNRLDALYPVTADGSPDCYATTLNDAMQQADAAIGAARHYSSNE